MRFQIFQTLSATIFHNDAKESVEIQRIYSSVFLSDALPQSSESLDSIKTVSLKANR